MKKMVNAVLICAALIAVPALAIEGDAETPETVSTVHKQTTCPVMGGTIDSTLYVEHEGQKVYFCCAGCKPMFEKDPEKFMAKLKADETESKTKDAHKGHH